VDDRYHLVLIVLAGSNLIVRILLTLHHISKYPISFMLFHNLPVFNLFTSIKSTCIFTDLMSSFTKEYDGFRFNLCHSIHKLANLPFLVLQVTVIWGKIPYLIFPSTLFSKVSCVLSLGLCVFICLKKFYNSMKYHLLGCDLYEDFDDFTRNH